MATMEATERARTSAPPNVSDRTSDETKLSLKTTEFWAMGGIIAAILVARRYPTRSATSGPGRSSPQSGSAT